MFALSEECMTLNYLKPYNTHLKCFTGDTFDPHFAGAWQLAYFSILQAQKKKKQLTRRISSETHMSKSTSILLSELLEL